MPVSFVKKFADKYDIDIKTAEEKWEEARDIATKEYGQPSENPKSKKQKVKNSKIYGTTTNIFKNKIKKLVKNEKIITNFSDFINENNNI
jgi:hypothetical protein